MRKEVFVEKAEQMGDFQLFYSKEKSKKNVSFGICTADLSTPYIKDRIPKSLTVMPDQALLWDWTYDRHIIVPYAQIKKMTPLSAILKNGR